LALLADKMNKEFQLTGNFSKFIEWAIDKLPLFGAIFRTTMNALQISLTAMFPYLALFIYNFERINKNSRKFN
jgi:hypothetical protein